MFKAELSEKLKKIFALKKVTFDMPSDKFGGEDLPSHEQGVLFIEIANARTRIKDARQIARVNGKIRIYAQGEKLPFGFLTKALAEADGDDTENFFFYDLEENASSFVNIVERSASFVFFFSSQYNPEVGTLTSLNLQEDDE